MKFEILKLEEMDLGDGVVVRMTNVVCVQGCLTDWIARKRERSTLRNPVCPSVSQVRLNAVCGNCLLGQDIANGICVSQ
ncbi:MAG: hypothetical protein FWG65_09175 [Turicibacter sp.]|nr:hypothetical protein [Turicibacter sp.]